MKARWLFCCVLAGIGQACVPDQRTAAAPQTPVPREAAAEAGQANSPGGIDWIRKRYARIGEMEAAGLLRCDSLAYQCQNEPINGLFTYCYAGDDLVRATHGRSIGDHSFTTEEYYFDGAEMYFAHLREGGWQFAHPPGATGEETVSHTRDKVREERKYYADGNLIDRLFKSYELVSWEDRKPEDFPNAQEGEPIEDVLGPERTLAQRGAAHYACPE